MCKSGIVLGGDSGDLKCACGQSRYARQELCPYCFFRSLGYSKKDSELRAEQRHTNAEFALETGGYPGADWGRVRNVKKKRKLFMDWAIKRKQIPQYVANLIAIRKFPDPRIRAERI